MISLNSDDPGPWLAAGRLLPLWPRLLRGVHDGLKVRCIHSPEYRAFEYRHSASKFGVASSDPVPSMSPRPGLSSRRVLSARDLHTWNLFADWCAALDLSALPATSHTLALFLGAHPASAAIQRRRISVIDTAHHREALASPGRSEAVRTALDASRATRFNELAERLGTIIAGLPVSGWPAALFGRRDALILVLTSAGLPYTQIADLRVSDVTYDLTDDVLQLETATGVSTRTPRAVAQAGVSPVLVLRRWFEVLGFLNRYPSTTMLDEGLRTGNETALTGYDKGVFFRKAIGHC